MAIVTTIAIAIATIVIVIIINGILYSLVSNFCPLTNVQRTIKLYH